MIRKIAGITLIATLAVFATGCFETEYTIGIKRDGSGAITQTVLISKEMMEMGKNAGGQAPPQDGKNPMIEGMLKTDELKDTLDKIFGEGVELKTAEPFKKGDREGVKFVFTFKDINKINVLPDPMPKTAKKKKRGPQADKITPGLLSGNKKPIKFKFVEATGGSPAKLTILSEGVSTEGIAGAGPADNPQADNEMAKQMMEMMKEMMAGMRVRVNVKIDGSIVKSDATYLDKDKKLVDLIDVKIGDIIANEDLMNKFKAMEGKDEEAVKKFMEKPEVKAVMKVETKKKVTVEFK